MGHKVTWDGTNMGWWMVDGGRGKREEGRGKREEGRGGEGEREEVPT